MRLIALFVLPQHTLGPLVIAIMWAASEIELKEGRKCAPRHACFAFSAVQPATLSLWACQEEVPLTIAVPLSRRVSVIVETIFGGFSCYAFFAVFVLSAARLCCLQHILGPMWLSLLSGQHCTTGSKEGRQCAPGTRLAFSASQIATFIHFEHASKRCRG